MEAPVEIYLYRISTCAESWFKEEPKPIYFVCERDAQAEEWAKAVLSKGLKISKITKLAKQVGGLAWYEGI